MVTPLVSYTLFLVIILINVAFFTLIERKILGLRQNRKGPAKVSFIGLLQPVADAGKLFSKFYFIPLLSNKVIFSAGPILSITLILLCWLIYDRAQGRLDVEFSVILLLTVVRMGIYPPFIAGWGSNNKYSLLGAFRGIAQTVSYEVRFAFIIIRLFIVLSSLEVRGADYFGGETLRRRGLFIPLLPLWLVRCLAETNRTPFDFSEGERELVSGFNTEYARALFAAIFMAEYGTIAFFRLITPSFFLGGNINQGLLILLGVVVMF